jgi:hypothetical protein
MMVDCIVTAVEKVRSYTPKGCANTLTRDFTPDHYITGIKSLCDLHKPLIVYCNKPIQEMLIEHLEDKVDRLPIFVNKESPDINPYFNEIYEYSKKIVDRNPKGVYGWNPMLTTGKLFYILDAIQRGYEHVVWMDAGLSNESYLPEEHGGTWHDVNVQDWDKMYPVNKTCIFNPELGSRIFNLFQKHSNFMMGIPYIGNEPGDFIRECWSKPIEYWSASPGLMGMTKQKALSIKEMYISAILYYIHRYDRIFTEIELFTFLNVHFDFGKLTISKFDPTTEKGTMYDLLKNKINHDEIRFNNSDI